MVTIHFELAKFETLHNNLWNKHIKAKIFSSRREDNKSASDNNDCVPGEAQTELCLITVINANAAATLLEQRPEKNFRL